MLRASRDDVVFDEESSLYTTEPTIDMVEKPMTMIPLALVDHRIQTALVTRKLANQLAGQIANRLTNQLAGVEISKKT